jgi:hypothetical protein
VAPALADLPADFHWADSALPASLDQVQLAALHLVGSVPPAWKVAQSVGSEMLAALGRAMSADFHRAGSAFLGWTVAWPVAWAAVDSVSPDDLRPAGPAYPDWTAAWPAADSVSVVVDSAFPDGLHQAGPAFPDSMAAWPAADSAA